MFSKASPCGLNTESREIFGIKDTYLLMCNISRTGVTALTRDGLEGQAFHNAVIRMAQIFAIFKFFFGLPVLDMEIAVRTSSKIG